MSRSASQVFDESCSSGETLLDWHSSQRRQKKQGPSAQNPPHIAIGPRPSRPHVGHWIASMEENGPLRSNAI